jgi:hypothetical protein
MRVYFSKQAINKNLQDIDIWKILDFALEKLSNKKRPSLNQKRKYHGLDDTTKVVFRILRLSQPLLDAADRNTEILLPL